MTIGGRHVVLLLCTLVVAGCAPNSIATTRVASGSSRVENTGFVPVGGIDQWISVRGDNRHNPVILVVHGGPGEAQWSAAAKYQPWERDFVVVQWDQRGAGRTFGRNGAQTPDVNLERIARDGVEVAEHLCRRLDKKKIIVLGHSWGSIVAIHMVQRRPELFAAYVGTGQVASWKASVQAQFDVLLAKARADNDTAGLNELEAIGRPDPGNARQYFQFTKELGAAMPAADQEWLKNLRASTPASLGVDDKDFQDLGAGMAFKGEGARESAGRHRRGGPFRLHDSSWRISRGAHRQGASSRPLSWRLRSEPDSDPSEESQRHARGWVYKERMPRGEIGHVRWNPAMLIPCGFTKAGLPIGLQLSGAPWREAVVLRFAHTYQQATNWHTRRPGSAASDRS